MTFGISQRHNPSVVAHFFLDRGLGSRIVPDGLRANGWDLTTMDERYGAEISQSIIDAEWIADASERGDCILTKDTHVAYRPAEAEAIYRSGARVFTVRNAQMAGPDVLELLVRHTAVIRRVADRARGPYVFGVGPAGLGRLNLKGF